MDRGEAAVGSIAGAGDTRACHTSLKDLRVGHGNGIIDRFKIEVFFLIFVEKYFPKKYDVGRMENFE